MQSIIDSLPFGRMVQPKEQPRRAQVFRRWRYEYKALTDPAPDTAYAWSKTFKKSLHTLERIVGFLPIGSTGPPGELSRLISNMTEANRAGKASSEPQARLWKMTEIASLRDTSAVACEEAHQLSELSEDNVKDRCCQVQFLGDTG